MPQMMPINWMLYLFFFLLIFILFIMMNYFLFMNKINKKKIMKFYKKNLYWKW